MGNRFGDKIKMVLKSMLILVICALPFASFSQDVDARSPKPNSGSSQQVKADKKKEKQKKEAAKGIWWRQVSESQSVGMKIKESSF